MAGPHLSDPEALVVLGLQCHQQDPVALVSQGNRQCLVYLQGLVGQNLEDPPPRCHLSAPKNLNRNE